MTYLSRLLLVTLSLGVGLDARALGVPPGCRVQSPALKAARECFSGDMREVEDASMFIGVDDTSTMDLNYCFNALITPYAPRGAALSVMVLKDDARGQIVGRTFTVGSAALAASLGRVPTNHKAQVLRLNGLTADCFAKRGATNLCSKGFFGFGGTDLPFAITLENALTGYVVRGGVRDRAIIEIPGVPSVNADGVLPTEGTVQWLVGQIRHRLVNRVRRELSAPPTTPPARQFQYCRLAFEQLNRNLNRPSPFDATETKMFEDLDRLRQGPATAAPPAVVSVPSAAPTPAPAPTPANSPASPHPAPSPSSASSKRRPADEIP